MGQRDHRTSHLIGARVTSDLVMRDSSPRVSYSGGVMSARHHPGGPDTLRGHIGAFTIWCLEVPSQWRMTARPSSVSSPTGVISCLRLR